jgi:hypothetical protein
MLAQGHALNIYSDTTSETRESLQYSVVVAARLLWYRCALRCAPPISSVAY